MREGDTVRIWLSRKRRSYVEGVVERGTVPGVTDEGQRVQQPALLVRAKKELRFGKEFPPIQELWSLGEARARYEVELVPAASPKA